MSALDWPGPDIALTHSGRFSTPLTLPNPPRHAPPQEAKVNGDVTLEVSGGVREKPDNPLALPASTSMAGATEAQRVRNERESWGAGETGVFVVGSLLLL